MDFDSFSNESSLQSDDENLISDQLNKTKSLPIKFFTDLNKHQKVLNKRQNQKDNKKQPSKKKIKNKSPTFNEMMMFKKNSQYAGSIELNMHDSGSKKKVRFNNRNQKRNQNSNQRGTSIQKMNNINFCDTIKQMAIQLTQSNKQCLTEQDKNGDDQNELFSGYTEKEFADGTKFKGICEKGVIIRGQLCFSNGYVYDGQLFLDKFHGQGKLTLPKKQVIQADWIEGQIVGKGTITYPKGQIYYGDIKNYRRQGKGHLFFSDGSKYEGQFNQGDLIGYGVHIATSGQKNAGYWFYGDYVGSNQQVFDNVMTNIAAHEKKKTEKYTKIQVLLGAQKQNDKQILSKNKGDRRSLVQEKNLLQELFLNMNNFQ